MNIFNKILILVALDVSGSMKEPFSQSSSSKAEPLMSAIKEIVNNDHNNKMIKIGISLFGCKKAPTCDFLLFLSLLQINRLKSNFPVQYQAKCQTYKECLALVGYKYGAYSLTDYMKNIPESICKEIYEIIIEDENLLCGIIYHLPWQVKSEYASYGITNGVGFVNKIDNFFTKSHRIQQKYDKSVEEEVYSVLKRCFKYVESFISCEKYNWTKPIDLLLMNGNELKELINNIFDKIGINSFMYYIQNYIYGMTPTSIALEECFSKFHQNQNTKHKILFLITDGQNNQGKDPYELIREKLKHDELKNVMIVSCYFSSSYIENPRKLYYREPEKINEFCKKLFDISSIVPVDSPGLRILANKYHWELPKERVCHLFFQVNHPDIINEISQVLSDFVNDQNQFMNSFSSIYFDMIKNDQLNNQKSFEQIRKTCYAYACSGAIQLALCRIYSREIPSFESIVNPIIKKHGYDGGNVKQVLTENCPKYGLHFNILKNENEARVALALGRACVGIFNLPNDAWDKFSKFFTNNPKGILKKSDLLQPDGTLGDWSNYSGHAVILIDANIVALEFLNSWGSDWGNKGRFRIENAEVLDVLFFDIYWTLNDLTDKEKDNYQRAVNDTSKAIENNDPDSDKFYALYLICPHCGFKMKSDKFINTNKYFCYKCKKDIDPAKLKFLRGIYE